MLLDVVGEPAGRGESGAGGPRTASRPFAESELALAYVGSLVPDEPAFHGRAFSRAGQRFQRELLLALRRAGVPLSRILSMRPLPAFPGSPTLWAGGGEAETAGGLRLRFLPFCNVHPLKAISLGISTLASLVKWRWQTRGARGHMVLVCNLTLPPGLVSLLAARLIGATAIAMVLEVDVPGEMVPATIWRRANAALHRWLIPRFDGLAVSAKAIAHDFAPDLPYVHIEGGVTQEVLAHFRTTGPRAAGQAFTLAFAGDLTDINGLPTLLDAMALLEGPGYRLRIAGPGPLADLVRERARLDPRIEYCGVLPFDHVLDLYSEADLLLNVRPTKTLHTRHCFPSKLMEYLASGTPVVTTCTGHVEEEFQGMAFLLRDESATGLAQLIRHVASLAPRDRTSVAERAREHMGAAKTWDLQGQRLAALIRRLKDQGAAS